MADGSIVIDTKIDSSGVKSDLSKISSNIKKGMKGAAKVAVVSLGAITGAVTALGAASVKFAKTTDRIDKMSQRLTLSRKAFQEWDFILSQSGVSIDSMQMSMKTLTQEIKRDSDAFKTLGVSAKDAEGNFRSQEEVFKDTIIALQGMEAGIEKSALAQKLFGRNGQELLPLLNAQAGSVEELTKKANELGLILSDDVVDAGVLLTDQMDQMKRSISNVLTVAFLPLATKLNEVIKRFVDWAIANQGVQKTIENLKNSITILKTVWTQVVGAFQLGTITIVEFFKVTTINIKSLFTKIVAFGETTVTKLVGVFKSAGIAIKTSFITAFNSIKIATVELTQLILDKLLGGVQKMLELFALLPFVGEKFAGLASDVSGVRKGLEELKNEAVNANMEMIKLAEDQRAEFKKTQEEKIKGIEDEKLTRIKALEEQKKLTKAQADAEREAVKETTKIKLAELEKSLDQIEYTYLEEEEAIYSHGYNAGRAYADGLNSSSKQISKVLTGIEQSIFDAIDSIKSGGLGKILKDTASFIGNIFLKSLSTVVTYGRRFSDMFFETISYLSDFSTTTILENLDSTLKALEGFFFEGGELYSISNMFNAGISWVQDFVDGLEENKESIFNEMGNIFTSLSNQITENTELFTAIGQILGEFIGVIVENLPLVLDAGLQLISSLASGILENIDIIIDSAITLVMSIVNYIVDNLPTLLQAGFDILMSVISGITENTEEIVNAAVQIVTAIITFIGENLDELIEAGLQINLALAQGIAENIDEIITAIIGMIPDIVTAIIGALPDIVAAWVQMIPELALALVKATPEILEAIGQLIVDMIDAFGDFIDSAPEIVKAFFESFGDSVKEQSGAMGDILTNAGEDILEGLGLKEQATTPVEVDPLLLTPNSELSMPELMVKEAILRKMEADGIDISSYDVGTPYVDRDQLANIHKGERIVPKSFNQSLMSGDTMMLSPEAFTSVMNGLQGGMVQPSLLSGNSNNISINVNMTGNMEVDGRAIGQIAYQYVDENVGGAYGS